MGRWFPWRRLPVLLGAALLTFVWAQIAWNATGGAVFPRLHIRVRAPLAGQTEAVRPDASPANLLSGRWQQDFAARAGELASLRSLAVRWKNQVYYSAFEMSGVPTIAVGRDGELFEWGYIREYCSRDLNDLRRRAGAWAGRLREMQDFFERRGKIFIYLITPSKAGVYPEYIPADFACRARPEDRVGKLAAYKEALDRAGVRRVDAAGLIAAAKPDSKIDLFPRGGAHWNRLGAAMAAKAVTENVARTKPLLTPFSIDWRTSNNPQGSDRDLYEVINLVFRDDRYPVPVVSYFDQPPPACKPARIVEVSGSFIFEMNEALVSVSCPPRISAWFYWSLRHFEYPPGTSAFAPNDPALRAADLLRDADIVILEENETGLPGSEHGKQLLRFVQEQATDAQRPADSSPLGEKRVEIPFQSSFPSR